MQPKIITTGPKHSSSVKREQNNGNKKLLEKGLKFLAQKDYETALYYFDDVIKSDPNDQNAIFNKGRALILLGKYDEGTKCYKKLVDLGEKSLHNNHPPPSPNNLKEHEGYTTQIVNSNKQSVEVPIESRVINNDYNPNIFNFDESEDKNSELTYDRVITLCDELLRRDPNNIDALLNKSMALGLRGQYELAIECCDQVLDFEPENYKSLKNKAIFFEQMNKYGAAIDFYNKALNINSDNIDCLFGKGMILNQLERYNDAVICFDKILNIDPENQAAIINKGISLGHLNHRQEAMDCYDKIIADQKNRIENNIDSSIETEELEINDFETTVLYKNNNNVAIDDLNEKTTSFQNRQNSGPNLVGSESLEFKGDDALKPNYIGEIRTQQTGDEPKQFVVDRSLDEHKRELNGVMKLLRKQRGGSFYYVVETIKLFKVSTLILQTLIQDYNMDGVVVCLDKPPKYYQKVLTKKLNIDHKIYFINTLSNLVTDNTQIHSNSNPVKVQRNQDVFFLNSNNINLDNLVELIEISMQKIVEKSSGEDHFVMFDNIAGLQPFYSINKIKKFANNFGARLKELNLYGIVMAPKETVHVKVKDIIKAIPSIITKKLRNN